MKKLLALTSLLLLSACEMSPVYNYVFRISNYSVQSVFAEFEFDNKSFSDTLRPYNGNSPRVLSGNVNLYEDLDLQTINSMYTCSLTIIDSDTVIEISNLDEYIYYTSEDDLPTGRRIISKSFGYNIW